jgi:N-dimethylarginine dimethylaminohydrolase
VKSGLIETILCVSNQDYLCDEIFAMNMMLYVPSHGVASSYRAWVRARTSSTYNDMLQEAGTVSRTRSESILNAFVLNMNIKF